jgi:hypothetical protein
VLEKVLAAQPEHREARKTLVDALDLRATTSMNLTRHADALADWDRALAFQTVSPSRDSLRVGRAEALARLGDHARATAEADTLLQDAALTPNLLHDLAIVYAVAAGAARQDPKRHEEFAGRAVQLLKRLQASGYFKDAAALKESKDLAPLRERADFKALLGELGKSGR